MRQQQYPFILCVDDDADDQMMLREAFEATGCTYPIRMANNGEEALQQLEVMVQENGLPCLIVLDVNMPRINGRETLLALQSDDKLAGIPVVAYSTSSSQLDKMFFLHHKVAFFTKPNYFAEMETIAALMLHHCRTQQSSNALGPQA